MRRLASTALATAGFTLVAGLSPVVAFGPAFALLALSSYLVVGPALVSR